MTSVPVLARPDMDEQAWQMQNLGNTECPLQTSEYCLRVKGLFTLHWLRI